MAVHMDKYQIGLISGDNCHDKNDRSGQKVWIHVKDGQQAKR